ncbi:hypothetical protein HK405_000556, partial [Cladochytrium tenue]
MPETHQFVFVPSLCVLSRTDTATNPFYKVHRYPALGPDTPLANNSSDSSSTSTAAASSSSSVNATCTLTSASAFASAAAAASTTGPAAPTSSPPGTPLLTLNASTYPMLPADVSPSYLAAHLQIELTDVPAACWNGMQPFVSLASANDSIYGVLVYAPASDPTAADTEPYVLTQWVRTSFLDLRALDVDNDGTVLFVAGDDGADEGRLDSLDVSGSDSATAPAPARNFAVTAFATATSAFL